MAKDIVLVALLAATRIEHDGEIYLPGDTLEVSEAQAVSLVDVGAATVVEVAADASADATATVGKSKKQA